MAANKTPNVILVYADDLGYGDLTCYGGVGVETPQCGQAFGKRNKVY